MLSFKEVIYRKINLIWRRPNEIQSCSSRKKAKMYYLIHDPLRSLLYSLESLGHDVIVQKDTMAKDRVNIIALGERLTIQDIDKIIASKVPYIVYQTEVFTDNGLEFSRRCYQRALFGKTRALFEIMSSCYHDMGML